MPHKLCTLSACVCECFKELYLRFECAAVHVGGFSGCCNLRQQFALGLYLAVLYVKYVYFVQVFTEPTSLTATSAGCVRCT